MAIITGSTHKQQHRNNTHIQIKHNTVWSLLSGTSWAASAQPWPVGSGPPCCPAMGQLWLSPLHKQALQELPGQAQPGNLRPWKRWQQGPWPWAQCLLELWPGWQVALQSLMCLLMSSYSVACGVLASFEDSQQPVRQPVRQPSLPCPHPRPFPRPWPFLLPCF